MVGLVDQLFACWRLLKRSWPRNNRRKEKEAEQTAQSNRPASLQLDAQFLHLFFIFISLFLILCVGGGGTVF